MLAVKPTIVLIHRTWHVPEHYKRLTSALQTVGFETKCPHLPTCSDIRPASATLENDVSTAREVIEPLVSTGQNVVVIAHSYGGVVASNTLFGLSMQERASNGLAGGVSHLFYMTAFFLPSSGNVAAASTADPSPVEVAEDGTSFMQGPEHLFYDDLDTGDAEEQTRHLVRHCFSAFRQPVEHAP